MAKGLLGAALLAACLAAALRGAAAKGQHDFVLPQQHQQEQQQEQAQAARAGKHDFVMQQPGQEQKEQTQPEYASKHDFVMPGQEQEKKAQAAPEPQQPRAHAARTHADAALWRWLNDNGAALNYVPAVSEFGLRGGIALNDIQAGGLVASIPMRLAMYFPAKYESFADLGAQLALEARKADSPYRPYLDSLAALSDAHHVLSWESFPPSYLHLLQDAQPLADQVLARQLSLERYWSRRGADLMRAGVTLEDLRAALVTITTRWFNGSPEGPHAGEGMLIPGLDSLNHHNECPVKYFLAPCPALRARSDGDHHAAAAAAANKAAADANETCLIATTDMAVDAGTELCISYGRLTPDLAVMQYGFLLPDGLDLSKVDQKGVTVEDVSTDRMHSPSPPRMKASWAALDKLQAELDRVTARLMAVQAAEPLAQMTKPDPVADPRGELLELVVRWRAQRKAALAAEAARLHDEVAAAASKAAGAGAGVPKPVAKGARSDEL